LWRLLDAKITMVGVESDHRETQRRLGRAGQGTNVRDHEVGTDAFTRDLCPSASLAALSWVHLVCLTRRGPNRRSAASRMLACLLLLHLT